jgi:nicotinamide-nucleotide amidase
MPHVLHRAEIVAVGSEMLTPDRSDTNSLFITSRLNELGVQVAAKAVVADHAGTLTSVVRGALDRADLVVLTGGLGPTDDDLTRQAVAAVLGRRLVEDSAILDAIRERFERRGLVMPEINRRQAEVIEGAEVLANAFGTAPGQFIDLGDRALALLPGPPREMRPMLEALLAAQLAARSGGDRLFRGTVRLVGRTESHAEERLKPFYERWAAAEPIVSATILAARAQIELQLWARAADAVRGQTAIAAAIADVAGEFGDDVVSTDGRSLEQTVGDLLRDRGLRLALAESCTGGLVTSRLTDVAGSSDYIERAIVAYSNQAKIDWLGVPERVIAAHGAVSEDVALAMAEGVRRLSGVQVGVAVTGIAGPGGGTETKPVGTVCFAVVGPGEAHLVRTANVPGNRTQVKSFSSTLAIDMVRRAVARI